MASYENYPQPEEEPQKDPGKGRLKLVLGIVLAAAVVAAVVIGVNVWRNSTLSTAYQADTEALSQDSAGVSNTTFDAVDLKGVPAYTSMYSKTLKQLASLKKSSLSFDSKLKKAAVVPSALPKAAAKKIRYSASALSKEQDGVSLTVFFDKSKKSVAMLYSFDLDALKVAEADFAVFAADKTVPVSLLSGVGISENVAKDALNSQSSQSNIDEQANTRSCTYKQATGQKLKKSVKTKKVYNKKKHKKIKKKIVKKTQVAYMTWQLDETYEYASGDRATTRTATVLFY